MISLLEQRKEKLSQKLWPPRTAATPKGIAPTLIGPKDLITYTFISFHPVQSVLTPTGYNWHAYRVTLVQCTEGWRVQYQTRLYSGN
jgi:hypothetical protein